MAMALLRRLLAISVLVGVPLGSLWVLFGDYIPKTIHPPREAGAEESPFVMGSETYRGIYVRDGEREERIRRRWGRLPFELPSASSCLAEPLAEGAQPATQKLAWEKITSIEALDVCLTRVLNRFNDDDPAIEWLRHQGFGLNHQEPETLCPGEWLYLYWSASGIGGPEMFWQSLSWWEKFSNTGIVVNVMMCRSISEPDSWLQIGFLLTGEPPPYFDVQPQLRGKWQK